MAYEYQRKKVHKSLETFGSSCVINVEGIGVRVVVGGVGADG